MLKGTQRRFAVGIAALTAITPALLLVRPAAAFPPGHKISKFDYKFVATTHIAKLKQTIAPPSGAFLGGIDTVTNQMNGGIKLPSGGGFKDASAGLTGVTMSLVQTKPMTGHVNRKTGQITATSTFVMHIVSAYGSKPALASSPNASGLPSGLPSLTLPTLPITLPTLPGVTLPTLPVTVPTLPTTPAPPVNLVGNKCASGPIAMTLHGIATAGAPFKLTGTYTLPKFSLCGTLTGLLNSLLPGPGNTFSGTASSNPSAPTQTIPSLPITLPTLPVLTLPSLPITLPTLPITLPTLPITLPTLPGVTLPTLPITLPSLPITVPTLPVTVPTLPSH